MNHQQTAISFPNREAGYVCPCCKRFVKVYRRSFNSNMGLSLIALYKAKGFVHLENLMREKGYKRCGDASSLFWYGFIEKLPLKREDDSKRNGYYKITGRGIMFVECKITAKEKFLMYNNKCEGFDGEEINIIDALGRKFSYLELMSSP